MRDKAVHEEVVQMICDFAVGNGYSVQGLTFSPVKGPEGNIEYLVFLQKSDAPVNTAESTPHEIVEMCIRDRLICKGIRKSRAQTECV